MKRLFALLTVFGFSGCAMEPVTSVQEDVPDILTIHSDGVMEFKNRKLNEEDVVIYPDGFGGERAAVKMYVPLRSDYFYRDSITVLRMDEEITITQN